ncbi:MAG: four helix bundle protein [Acidimicrobiia bacterium]|nr:four helix bundle protein [Acidimicrobiia bacterium]
MRDFTDLRVWQRARCLSSHCHDITKSFPASERYGLTSQIRRCAVSVAANIAEGCGRETPADLRRFLHISAGSLSELESHLLICSDLGLISQEELRSSRAEIRTVRRMVHGFATKTQAW